jgi:tetratricopeptide (TPR) repeat protein
MSQARMAACFLTFLTLPSLCSAQSKSLTLLLDDSESTVSVHELSVPQKTRDAFNKATRLLAVKNLTGSISQFQRAINAFPTFYEAYYRMGLAELKLQHAAEAETAFRKSIELSEGRYAPPHFGLGLVLWQEEKQFAEAEATVRTGLQLDPSDAGGAFTLAWMLYNTDRLPEAEKSARQAVIYEPTFAMVYLLLAQIHLRRNNQSGVVQDLNAYLRLDADSPASAQARTLLAEAQRALSQESARSVLAQANPGDGSLGP